MTAIPPRPQEAENPRPNLLKRHLRNEDWTMSEISDFLHDYEVARQLRTNRRLSDLTAAGLVDWLQKNQD